MVIYRAFFLDKYNNITERRDFEVNDNAEAVETAKTWMNGQAIAVCVGPVLVEILKPKSARK